jgi:hypothetical protein
MIDAWIAYSAPTRLAAASGHDSSDTTTRLVADGLLIVYSLLVLLLVARGVRLLVLRYQRAAAIRRGPTAWPEKPILLTPLPADAELAAGLGVGALRAVRAGEPVTTLLGESQQRARCKDELLALFPHEPANVRANTRRALRELLGHGAEVVGDSHRDLEEVLRHRNRVGAELWRHSLHEFGIERSLPLAERESLLRLADETERAEDELRQHDVLGPREQIPTVLAVRWAFGVHLARTAVRAGWLDEDHAAAFVRRAGVLVGRWYPSWTAVASGLLLPALIADDRVVAEWGMRVAQQLLTAPASPWQVTLPPRHTSGAAG